MSSDKSYRPNHRVTMYRKANGFIPEDVSPDVISLSTAKAYSMGAGGFQILTTFRPRYEQKRYDELLQPDDRILIELDKGDGQGLKPAMLGQVDRASREENYENPQRPVRQVKIAGSDMGKPLIRHNCSWDIEVKDPNAVQFEGDEASIRVREFGGKLCGTPAMLIRKIIETLLYSQLPWTKQFIIADRIDTADDWWMMDESVAARVGSLWAILKLYENHPWNILTGDTLDDGKYHIILEQTPFDATTGRLTRTDLYRLTDSDIVRLSLAPSDNEMVNFILHDTALGVFRDSALSNLIFLAGKSVRRFDAESIAYHGFRRHEIKTDFTVVKTSPPTPPRLSNGGSVPTIVDAVEARTEAYWNWFKNNHLMETGTIVVKGDPSIKAGMGILRTSDNKEYLAEQVSHNYVWGGAFTTSVGVTRGQDHGRV